MEELLAEAMGPLKPQQAKHLDYYKPDVAYRAWGEFKETPGTKPFMVQTHSGKQKPYREYGQVSFRIKDTLLTLHVYQNIDLINNATYKNYLFVPFNDLTNYVATYGGGRYIDITIDDIKNGKVLIDFNKCYNPYCAYADGYSCPIPPKENYLQMEIRAGEKAFIE